LPFFLVLVFFVPSSGLCLDTIVGVKGGAGVFSYLGEDYEDSLDTYDLTNDWKWGFAAGVSVALELTDVFALQPEILIVGAGDAYREDASVYGPYSEWVLAIDQLLYVTLPVLVKVRFWRFSIVAGPMPMLMLGNGKLRLKAQDENLQYDLESVGWDSVDYADGVFSKFALAVTGGTGIDLPLRRRRGVLSLEVRGYYVLTNVLDESQGMDFQSYGFLVMAGYGLDSARRNFAGTKIR
jgi:hypothetical protein